MCRMRNGQKKNGIMRKGVHLKWLREPQPLYQEHPDPEEQTYREMVLGNYGSSQLVSRATIVRGYSHSEACVEEIIHIRSTLR